MAGLSRGGVLRGEGVGASGGGGGGGGVMAEAALDARVEGSYENSRLRQGVSGLAC